MPGVHDRYDAQCNHQFDISHICVGMVLYEHLECRYHSRLASYLDGIVTALLKAVGDSEMPYSL